jgi:S-adenosylmethionine:tRNA ribosyltransferase-isomerase
VVRALEASAAEHGGVRAGRGLARLVLGPGSRLRVVEGLLTGLHEQGSSHFMLLQAFAKRELLISALASAESAGYLNHEFGDSCLILSSKLRVESPEYQRAA